MFNYLKCCASSALVLTLFQSFVPCIAADLPLRFARVFPKKVDEVGKRPKTWKDGSVEELARNIDWLEHHINMNGTVVAKTPDVWGEARLTAHRQEFEDVLKQELFQFQKNAVHGADFVSDQAFLAFAMNVQAGSGTAPTVPTPTSFTGPGSSVFGGSPFGANPFGANPQIQVEQTEVLDQLANYVNHLHALRRNNEGPDTADAPGYAMNLVHIPISVLPGQNTRRGYGAEMTITAEPYIGPDLLPTAFRDFSINDLVDQLSLPLVMYFNSDPNMARDDMEIVQFFEETRTRIKRGDGPPKYDELSGDETKENLLKTLKKQLKITRENFDEQIRQYISDDGDLTSAIPADVTGTRKVLQVAQSVLPQPARVQTEARFEPFLQTRPRPLDIPSVVPQPQSVLSVVTQPSNIQSGGAKPRNVKFENFTKTLTEKIISVNIAASATRRATFPFPPSQLNDNFGDVELARIILHVWQAFKDDLFNREVVHISDLQSFLREEISNAYELLSEPSMVTLWNMDTEFGQIRLSELVRTRNAIQIDARRKEFQNRLRQSGAVSSEGQISVTGDLA